MFYSCELCIYAGFTNMVLQQTWFLEVLMVFQTWRPISLFLAF
jgi:hypothetical protein